MVNYSGNRRIYDVLIIVFCQLSTVIAFILQGALSANTVGYDNRQSEYNGLSIYEQINVLDPLAIGRQIKRIGLFKQRDRLANCKYLTVLHEIYV
jgi:hypothetical protein